ncbi:hypothetical protein RvY_08044 [Ramazzottius varieornatus]|uniref:BTB domain-containing protein n=1 Tax=Ramazzottius varieornatus TaxID=947166 RepID=A0A1D1V4H8_RAMVA|nr:hypothetical protein RvY_08044 [Ramazzottius varieornatus]
MFECPTGRDFIFGSSDGPERPVHKVRLVISSSIFSWMLEPNVAECQRGRCVLKEVSTKTLDALFAILYMHYFGLENLKEEARALLEAAVKYEMVDLKKHREETLIADRRWTT